MKFTQLPLWSEEDLPPVLEPPSPDPDDPPGGIYQGNSERKGEEAYIQLSLPEFDEADLD